MRLMLVAAVSEDKKFVLAHSRPPVLRPIVLLLPSYLCCRRVAAAFNLA